MGHCFICGLSNEEFNDKTIENIRRWRFALKQSRLTLKVNLTGKHLVLFNVEMKIFFAASLKLIRKKICVRAISAD